MKFQVFFVLLSFCYVDCRKAIAPINKNANIDFINMEGGGVPIQNNNRPLAGPQTTPKPAISLPTPVPNQKPAVLQPGQGPLLTVTQPSPKPVVPNVAPQSPTQVPHLITPKPVKPVPVSSPITTPGPGSVKSLINFYDSQGKASAIRPYSYSQAVKQG